MHISDHVLRCFLALADAGQFTVAAERCHLTQSALSQMISRLEERVGMQLFNRDARSVTPTDEGRRFAETARRITADLDRAIADLRDIATLQAGQVALAVVPSLAVVWLPQVLQQFHQRHPAVRLQLHDQSSVRCLELVRQGVVDFALNSQPGTPHEMDAELLFEESLYLVCPPNHPLARETQVTARSLTGLPLLHTQGTDNMLVRTGKGMRGARRALYEAGAVDSGFEVASLATLAGLVASGLGACLAPESALPQFSLLPTRAVRISPRMMTRPIYFVHQKGRTLSHAARGMRELLFRSPRPGSVGASTARARSKK
ncbi:DNA-binding transcriptional regulator, LysR family [Variovorax sp. HW608]|uniref:LysR family transcriptional regulator n=1 Tax=Variovorax sp. HW608 TaxID=1034889 RepID=UPI0008200196|nr:LysR family transcriptional regulator [Variovorax sp. HW608]SCK43479.1 DNA-binding transcriptional regulator, LysR family [Variovorax sp. HW608]